jgi:SEC-C motif-containing protein
MLRRPDNRWMPHPPVSPTPPARPALDDTARCPCLSGETYGGCCAPFHRAESLAPTAERLMRSRYSAYAVGEAAYLLATWHPRTRPETLELDPAMRWYRLDIEGTARGGLLDTTGTVEFRARYRLDGGAGEQHETSRFSREGRRWYYVDAV